MKTAECSIRSYVLSTTLSAICLILVGCKHESGEANEPNAPNEPAPRSVIIQPTEPAAGYMLDFRYRLVAPNKAAPLFDERVKPYLEHPASGAKLIVPTPPKVGLLRQTPDTPVVDKIHFIMFANPGRLVKTGETVTVIVGNFKAEDVTVH